jgi:LacI family transcriptional regulator
MATMRDVANRAGVSPSTVSHVINNTRFVDPQTRERVVTAIDALGYRPNSVARSLRQRQTHTIGLVVPDSSSAFFAGVSRAVEDAGFNAGYSVILGNSDSSQVKERTYINVLLSKQVDGLILMSLGNDPTTVHTAIEEQVPVVVVDRVLQGANVDQILIDNQQGGYLAGQYLAKLGHTNVGCIGGPRGLSLADERLDGFRRALREAGIRLVENHVVHGDFELQAGVDGIRALFAVDPGITAVFTANDQMAIGAIYGLHQMGKGVPGDVSVIGFDDIVQARATIPPLTTIAQPMQELGAISVKILLDRIQTPFQAPRRIVLQTSLVERDSCTRPRLPGFKVRSAS